MEETNRNIQNLISIIVPVYNAKKTLAKCVESVKAQTYDNFELILVDDGSTDSSAEMCDAYKEDKRIRVIHIANSGVSHARNVGIDDAKGGWITFIDADDTVAPDYLERMIAPILSRQDAHKRAKEEGAQVANPTTIYVVTMTERIINSQPITGFYFIENGILNCDAHVWSKLYNKGIMSDLRFEEGLTIGEDMLFLMKLALKIGKERLMLAMPAGSYIYIDNANGATNSEYRTSYIDQIRCWQKAEELLEPFMGEISDYIYVQLATTQIVSALLVAGKLAQVDAENGAISREERKEAIAVIKEALRHARKKNGAFAGLSSGYKLKATIFRISPELYLKMYGTWKKK